MLLSDYGLRTVLASLGLTSSLFKPIPNYGAPLGTLDVSGSKIQDAQCLPPLDGLVVDCENGSPAAMVVMAVTTPSTTAPPPPSKTTLTASKTSESGFNVQDASCIVEPYNVPILSTAAFPPFDETRANIYRYRQQQGVNLGSWFVHEQWMTPSLFSCAAGKKVSELDIASGWGSIGSARALLERHWDTFITGDDFKYLASIGINTVRLPIGYWNLGPLYCHNTPFEAVSNVYQNSWPRIVRAINMAADAGIGVLVDLHGAPGSQNGQPHSGISDGQTNLFTNTTYQTQTLSVLTFLTQQLASVTNIIGIQILNEPQNVPELTEFYTRALATLRQVSLQAANFPFYIHDAFDLQRFSNYISDRQDFVVQDHHSYFVFTPKDNAESADEHTQDITGSIAQSLAAASQTQRNNLVIAEWSCALTPHSLAQEQDPEAAQRQYCEGQMQVYQNSTAGWSFWSYNKEACASDEGWCFKDAVGKDLPLSFFSYTGQKAGSPVPSPATLTALLNMHVPSQADILNLAAQDSVLEAFAPDPVDPVNIVAVPDAQMSPNATTNLLDALISLTTRSATRGQRKHRFLAIHSRRQVSDSFGMTESSVLSSTQQAVIKGYSDGFLTAKIFATYQLSKLGFRGQYIEDSLRSLVGVIGVEEQDVYRQSFKRGLVGGETLVRSHVLVTSTTAGALFDGGFQTPS